jgi:hypothetical protein
MKSDQSQQGSNAGQGRRMIQIEPLEKLVVGRPSHLDLALEPERAGGKLGPFETAKKIPRT